MTLSGHRVPRGAQSSRCRAQRPSMAPSYACQPQRRPPRTKRQQTAAGAERLCPRPPGVAVASRACRTRGVSAPSAALRFQWVMCEVVGVTGPGVCPEATKPRTFPIRLVRLQEGEGINGESDGCCTHRHPTLLLYMWKKRSSQVTFSFRFFLWIVILIFPSMGTLTTLYCERVKH